MTAGAKPSAAHRHYIRRRARQIAYGRWAPWADAGPVREHVRRLRQAGASYHAIAAAAGVSPMTVYGLLNGSRHQGHRQLPDRIGAAQAQRLLAISIAGCGPWRNACGVRRRLQALVALGHPPARLARELGISQQCVRRLLQAETRRVRLSLHTGVSELYGRLWNQMPGERTGRDRQPAETARAKAQAAGWPPPMALDDDRIDDPAYRPRIAWRRAVGVASQTNTRWT
jgi:DNA-binding CsgD family transcriptional regulator